MPKFHSKKSLIVGVVASAVMVVLMVVDICDKFALYKLFPLTVGVVLGIHCVDMVTYYKKHRIVKIEKTGNERIVYKG